MVGIFENALKKIAIVVKNPIWPILVVINFFSAFSKIFTKTTFVRLLFLKLKQKKNVKKS